VGGLQVMDVIVST